MTLGYILSKGGKPRVWKVEWRAILAFLAAKGRVCAQEVSDEFKLGKKIEVTEMRKRGKVGEKRVIKISRTRHTGPSEASFRLKRLASWGMIRRENIRNGRQYYQITDHGKQVNAGPVDGGNPKERTQ